MTYKKGKQTINNNADHSCESVLILQGGGSLGAYECGVYKALFKHDVNFDMIVGTSIGAVNASIIAGTKNTEKQAVQLENFWNELSENITPDILPEPMRLYFSAFQSAFWGNLNVALPITPFPNPWSVASAMPFLYNNLPLKKILEKYIDFDYLNNQNKIRLIMTSVDIQNSSPVVFDSKNTQIDVDHIISSTGYPFYGITWTKKNNRYLWDGSLMSNTPLREAINASPIKDKIVYLVSLFPKIHKKLPRNMLETWHRARDIMYADKAENNIAMSQTFSRYLDLLKNMHVILNAATLEPELKKKFQELEPEYHKIATRRGSIIKKITKIERKETGDFLFEDADFSRKTIKQLINDGQKDVESVLKNNQNN